MNRGNLKGIIGKALLATFTVGVVASSAAVVQAKEVSASIESSTLLERQEKAKETAETYLGKLGDALEDNKSASALKSAIRKAQVYIGKATTLDPELDETTLVGYSNIATATDRIADLGLIDAAKKALVKLPGTEKAAANAVKTKAGRAALEAKVATANEAVAAATDAGVGSEVTDLSYYERLEFANDAIEASVDDDAPVISSIKVNGKKINNIGGVFTVTLRDNASINTATIFADEAGTLAVETVEGYDADTLGVESVEFEERTTVSISQLLGDLDTGSNGIKAQTFQAFDSDDDGDFEVTGTVTDSLGNSTGVTLVIKFQN